MKKLRYLLLIIVLLFGFNVYALRISHYEPIFEMDQEYNNNQIIMYFGYRGEEAYKTTFKIEYDSKYIDYVKMAAGDNFEATVNKVSETGNKKVYEFSFTSNYVTSEILFGAIVFKVNSDFAINKTSEVKVYDIFSYNDNGDKYRSEGYYINLKRDDENSMLAMRTDINDNIKKERFLLSIIPYIIIGVVLVVLIILAIFLIPAKATENRKNKINAQIDPNNYPIPGVGPLPSIKKKKKKDIIEPEEKVIQPLSEFVSKSDEVNQELMNKEIEVDNDMFKDNPTKEGEQGLININPLAFDDGEEEVLDNSSNDDDIDTL